MKGVNTQTAYYLLKRYPRPLDILAHGLDALVCEFWKISRGRLGADRAKSLYEAAKTSVGIQEGSLGLMMDLQECLASIEQCTHFERELEKEMFRCLQEIPYSTLLLSMRGIGKVTIAGIIGEVGDFRNFKNISDLLKYAGLNFYEISSGQRKGNRHITKRGRALMRKLLFLAAVRMVRKGGIMHDHYQRYLQNGMKKVKALVAVSRKLLGIMLALVRDNSLYEEDHLQAGYRKAA